MPDETDAPTVATGSDPALEKTLSAWGETLKQNPGVSDPSLTLKATVPDLREAPTLPPRVDVLPAGEAEAMHAEYALLRELGRGGMGVVYEARQETLRRRVAIKMLLPEAASDRAERRFINESLVTGQLEHPSIVPVYDLGRAKDGRVYLGMKLVKGESFAARLRRAPATSATELRRSLEVIVRTCDAIAFAHAAGIVHLDLKPANVMLGEFGEVQVMDWGLAARTAELEKTDEAWPPQGTPAYMAPEQALGEPRRMGPWTDVYLIGSMLYEVLAGSPPHAGKTLFSVIRAAVEGKIEPPTQRAPEREIPHELEAICLRALAVEPAERWPTAAALKKELEEWLAHADAHKLLALARTIVAEDRAHEDRPHAERGQALVRARALVAQALEVWPESEPARVLAGEVGAREADLALERGDGAAAVACVARLVPGVGVPAEELERLRAAAARQVSRRRNEAIAAVVLLLAVAIGWGWFRSEQDAVAVVAREREARRDLATRTREAWRELSQAESPDAFSSTLARVRETVSVAAWAPDETDLPILTAAAVWQSLRSGSDSTALDHLASHLGPEVRALGIRATTEADPVATRDAWSSLVRARHVPDPLARAGEATLLLAWTRTFGTAATPSSSSWARAALERTGAPAVLADLRAGAIGGDAGSPRIATITTRVTIETSQHVLRRVRAVDPASGAIAWAWPDPVLAQLAARVLPPLVLPSSEGPLVAVAHGSDVILLDARTGEPRRRIRFHDPIAFLLPGEGDALFIVQPARAGRARSRLVAADARGNVAAHAQEFSLEEESVARRSAQLVAGIPTEPKDAQLAALLAQLERAERADATNPFFALEKALLHARGKRADEAVRFARAFARTEPSSAELAMAALRLDKVGIHDEADALIEAAIVARTRAGVNPDASPFLLGNPALWVRGAAEEAAKRGDAARARKRMGYARELATVVEGDSLLLALARRALLEQGLVDEVRALEPFEERCAMLGGSFLADPRVLERFDPAVCLLLAGVVVLLASIASLATRSRATLDADLRALGFRTAPSRWLALATNPGLRLRYTFLAYATRAERLVIVLASCAIVVGAIRARSIVEAVAQGAANPAAIGLGAMGHPTAQEWLRREAEMSEGDHVALDRLVAEGLLANGDDERARTLLRTILERAPGDPFALVNLGVLEERAGSTEAALARYVEAARAPGEPGMVGAWNAARLRREKLPALPVAYDGWRRATRGQGPLRQLAAADDLARVLEDARRTRSSMRERMVAVFAGTELAPIDLVMSGVPPLLRAAISVVLVLAFVGALVHLPFGTRPRTVVSPRDRLRERSGDVLDLIAPGVGNLARGRVVLGSLALAAWPFLWLARWMATYGGLLAAIAVPRVPALFGPVDEMDLLVTPATRVAGQLATAVIAVAYLATWARAAWRLVPTRRR